MKTVIRVTVVAGLVMAALSGVSHANEFNAEEYKAAIAQYDIGTPDNQQAAIKRIVALLPDANPTARANVVFWLGKRGVTVDPVPAVTAPVAQPERNTAADSHNYAWSAKQAEQKELKRVAQLKQRMLTTSKYNAVGSAPILVSVTPATHQTATAKPTVFAQTLTASTPAAKATVTAPEAPKDSIPASAITPATKPAVEAPVASQTVYQSADPETVQAVNDLIDAHNENVTAIDTNTAMIDNHEQRLGAIENHDKQQDRTISDNHKKAMAGIAGALAQTGLHYTDSDNSVAVGAGNYSGESAIAVGFSYQLSNKMRFSVQNSVDTQHKVGSSASIAYGW